MSQTIQELTKEQYDAQRAMIEARDLSAEAYIKLYDFEEAMKREANIANTYMLEAAVRHGRGSAPHLAALESVSKRKAELEAYRKELALKYHDARKKAHSAMVKVEKLNISTCPSIKTVYNG